MRWFHVSDLHFGYEQRNEIESMRDGLLELTARISPVDCLFITGDVRYAPNAGDGFPDEALPYIWTLQGALSVQPKDTFLVQGNHDANRPKGVILSSYEQGVSNYRPEKGEIDADLLDIVNSRRRNFQELYKKICGVAEPSYQEGDAVRPKWHYCRESHGFRIICLNTAMLSFKDGEQGSLILGTGFLKNMFDNIDDSLPLIVLAHHDLSHIVIGDQTVFKNRLDAIRKDKKEIIPYLCGHTHIITKPHEEKLNHHSLLTFTCGAGMNRTTSQGRADMVVLSGEMDKDRNDGYIRSYRWENNVNAFLPNQTFSYTEQQGYALDGRWYFPERPNGAKPAAQKYYDFIRQQCGEIGVTDRSEWGGIPRTRQDTRALFVKPRFWERGKFDSLLKTFKKTGNTGGVSNNVKELKDLFSENKPVRVLIFSEPGGGKSTLLKWLACAYAFPDEYPQEELSKRDLFPIWIPCQAIRSNPRSFENIIRDSLRNMPNSERIFDLMKKNIGNSRALLLIDGLDEAGVEKLKERVAMLSEFLGMEAFKKAHVIASLRGTGLAALQNIPEGVLDFQCFEIAPLNKTQIRKFGEKWWAVNGGIAGNERSTSQSPEQFAHDPPLLELAKNPLLLTNLLLLQSRRRQLPVRKSTLYQSAIETLLEKRYAREDGETALDSDELIRHLSYIAFYMMTKQMPVVSERELREIFEDMREKRPDLLLSEQKSQSLSAILKGGSILRQIYVGEFGGADALFEFSCKPFQEYLSALYMANSYDESMKESAWDCLEFPEVITLTAVMNIRFGQRITRCLYEQMLNEDSFFRKAQQRALLLDFLGEGVLLDEVLVSTILGECFVRHLRQDDMTPIEKILRGRYGGLLRKRLETIGVEQYQDAHYWCPLIRILSGTVSHPYNYYVEHRENCPKEALAVLNEALWLKRRNPYYEFEDMNFTPEQKAELVKEALRIASNDAVSAAVCRQAMRVLRELTGSQDPEGLIRKEAYPVFLEAAVNLTNLSAASEQKGAFLPIDFYTLALTLEGGDLELVKRILAPGTLDTLLKFDFRNVSADDMPVRYRDLLSLALLAILFHGETDAVRALLGLLETWRKTIWRKNPKYYKIVRHHFRFALVLEKTALHDSSVAPEVTEAVRSHILTEDLAILEQVEKNGDLDEKSIRNRFKTTSKEPYYPVLYPFAVGENAAADYGKVRAYLEAQRDAKKP